MLQSYIDVGEEILLRDPDEFGDLTVEDIQRIAACLYRTNVTAYNDQRERLKRAIVARLTSPRMNNDLVIIPTNSLFIEALVGTHPLLEDFKLIHRALDVKKVQAEVRHTELENVRLAARALKGKDEDPDIEKKVVLETNAQGITIGTD
jgi:hypothetical protein